MPDSTLASILSNRIRGTVVPVLAMFEQSGALDETAIADYVEFLTDSGVGTLMCTVGTSRYDVLTAEEMLRVNRIVSEAAKGVASVIVTTSGFGPTTQAIEFAKAAAKDGADAIVAVYPDRYYGDEPIFGFFEDICSAAEVGVMIHEMPIRAGRAFEAPSVHYSPKLVERILALPHAAGLKEESAEPELIKRLNQKFAAKAAVVGGRGGMAAHLAARQYGQVAYLASIGNIAPAIELEFVRLLEAGQTQQAAQIIAEFEKPFFDAAVDLGWHVALREAMSMAGRCPPFERRPMMRLTAAERRKLESITARIVDFSNQCNHSATGARA